jgi:hypothetical protein
MHVHGAHTAQIVVAKDSKLKLVRTYTFAEKNYPIANAHNLFRWASIAKLLIGMRASVQSQAWLEQPISSFLPALAPGATATNTQRFLSTRIIDLLRYQSGWKDDNGDGSYDYYPRVVEYGSGLLPLRPGDFGNFISNSKLDFLLKAPAKEERYNNLNFVAASEIVSQALKGGPDKYIDVMHEYWERSPDELRPRILAIPNSLTECLAAGEPPMRGAQGFSLATLTGKDFPLVEGGHPAWVPGGYRAGRDSEFTAGTGGFTMSGVTLARILQGMHPAPIAPVKPLLTAVQRGRMLTPNTAAIDTEGAAANLGLGPSIATRTYAGHEDTVQVSKGGSNLPTEKSQAFHYIWKDKPTLKYPTGAEHHLTLASTMFGRLAFDISPRVEKLEELGYWDSEVNLFPEFFGS